MEDIYANSLNNSSIYKNDLIQAERDFEKIEQFDPVELTEISGGIIALVSPTGCGKSHLLRDILSKIHSHYTSVYLMCPTAAVQDCYDYFPKENITDHFDEGLLTNIFNEQYSSLTKTEKNKKLKKPLVILDDVIGDPEFEKSVILNKIATAGRPIHLTVILLSQYFSKIKPLIRANLRTIIGFEIDNSSELEKLTDNFLCATNKRCGKLLYQKITREKKYQCCVVLIHKNYSTIDEKVKKYVADNVKKFKIKSVNGSTNSKNYGRLNPDLIPECGTELL